MTETSRPSEPATGPVTTTRTTPPGEPPTYTGPYREPDRRNRLSAVAAWVGIIAGIVFIVAVIFFTGFILGAHAGHGGGGGGWHRGHRDSAMMEHGGPGMGPRGQRQGPGGQFSQQPQPSQSSTTTTTPTTTSRP